MEVVAQLQNVTKHFGQIAALKNVSFDIYRKELCALLGPNGAGKTTALGILAGLRKPDKGSAMLFGKDPRIPQTRRQLGVTPQDINFPQNLKVGEVIDLIRAHFKNPLSKSEILQRVDLKEQEHRLTGGLSGGQKRRLSLALAFAGNAQLILCDEPTSGLDVESRHRLWQVIRNFHTNGGTLLLTSHYLEEIEALATRILVIGRGEIIFHGSVSEIKSHVALKRVRFNSASAPDLHGISRIERTNMTNTIYCLDSDELVRCLIRQDIPFENLEVTAATLEDAFLKVTRTAS